MPIRRVFVCLLLVWSFVLADGAAGQITAPPPSVAPAAQKWNRTFDAIESYIRFERKQAKAQQSFGQQLQDIIAAAALVREDAERELAAQQRLVDALGPPPGEGQPPEQQDVAKQRKDLNTAIASHRGRVAQADLAATRAKTLQTQLSEAYRADFLSRILERRDVSLAPADIARTLGETASTFGTMLMAPVTWYAGVPTEQRQDLWFGWQTLLIIASAVAAWPVRRWLLRRFGPDTATAEPSYARRLLAAIAVAVANGLIPSVLLAAIYFRITTDLNLNAGLAAEVVKQCSLALLFVIVTAALAKATLAPGHPAWRVTRLTAKSARRLYRTIVFLASVYVIDQAFTRIGATLPLSAEVSIAWIRLIGLIEALGLILLMRASLWQVERRADSEAAPQETTAGEGKAPPRELHVLRYSRYAVVSAAAATVVAKSFGYFALGLYIMQGLLNSAVVLAALYLLKRLAEEAITLLSSARIRDRRIAFEDEDRPNLRFWLTLAVNALIYGAALYALLIIWGVPRQDLERWLADAVGGFAIGGVTISLTDIGTAILVFAGGMFLTGRVCRLLDQKVLPRTNLDPGVRNSLATGAGYVGVVLAALIAVAVAGIDLSSLAIVAGALSVGIGFGLQNIVNNFVSGLILLAERPIKVGDWVVVGAQQGIVKHISVRATEIQSFDRSSVILPNSELLSQSVVNLTHKDKSGRIEVRVGVSYGSDVEKVRETLLACASNHAEVVSWPKPLVFFLDFGASSLDFVLYAFLSDVEKRLGVASELRFAIDKAFRENGIEIPYAQTEVHIRDIEKLVELLRAAPGPMPPPAAATAAAPQPSPAEPLPPIAEPAATPPLQRAPRPPIDSI